MWTMIVIEVAKGSFVDDGLKEMVRRRLEGPSKSALSCPAPPYYNHQLWEHRRNMPLTRNLHVSQAHELPLALH